MAFRVTISTTVQPDHAEDIALLAWLLEAGDLEDDPIDLFAAPLVNAFLYWRDRAVDLLPEKDVERLFAGFGMNVLERRMALRNELDGEKNN